MVLWSLLVISSFRHKKRMRKYIAKVRKTFDGVLLNEREGLLLQAYFEAMECIGLRDEVIADYENSVFKPNWQRSTNQKKNSK